MSSEPSPQANLTPAERGLRVWRRVIAWFEKHPWVIPGTIPFVVAVKVLRVAEGDMGTAQMIFGAQGVASLAGLVLVSAIPSAILAALLCGLILLGAIIGDGTWKATWKPETMLLASTFIGGHLLTSSQVVWAVTAAGLLIGVLMFLYTRGGRRRAQLPRRAAHAKRETREEIGSYGWPEFAWMATVFGLAGVVFSALIIGPMWMPAESVAIRGEAAVAGYVLSDDGNRAVVLLESDRTAASYRSEEIEERQRCQLTERQIQEQYSRVLAVPIIWWPHAQSSEHPDCPS